MNHIELGELESHNALGLSASDRSWSRFCDAFRKALGGNNDGDGDANGYSLDESYDYWRAGKTVAQYMHDIKARPNFNVRED